LFTATCVKLDHADSIMEQIIPTLARAAAPIRAEK
jgi:hypothetical protein